MGVKGKTSRHKCIYEDGPYDGRKRLWQGRFTMKSFLSIQSPFHFSISCCDDADPDSPRNRGPLWIRRHSDLFKTKKAKADSGAL